MEAKEPKKELTLEDFLQAGYREFHDSFNNSDFALEKRITDDKGIKYFILLYAYNFGKYPQHVGPTWSFETDIHFDAKEGYVRIVFGVHDVAAMEERVENFWRYVGSPYYERWDG